MMDAPEETFLALEAFTHRLRFLGWASALCAGLSLTTALASSVLITAHIPVYGGLVNWVYLLLVAGISSTIGGIIAVISFERLRQEGLLLYEEISDEVEWKHRTFRPGQTASSDFGESVALSRPHERPSFSLRVVLRRFLLAATLPLSPDRGGPILYLAVYIGTLAWQVVWLARSL